LERSDEPAADQARDFARLRRQGGLAAVARRPWHVGMGALAAGLALACAPLEVAMLAAATAAGAFGLLRGPVLGALAAGLLLAGAGVGHARLGAIDAPSQLVGGGGQVALRAHLLTRPRPSLFGASAEVRVATGRLAGARLLVRVPRWAAPLRAALGAELVVRGRLAPLGDRRREGTAREGFDFAAHLRRRGIAGELYLDKAQATGRRRGGLAGLLDRMRSRAEAGVAAGLQDREAALARGMTLGQDEEIPEPLREDFRASGLAHLLAVSGQNVMLLAALALPALALSGLGLRGRAAALLGLIALYVPLAGAGPSLQRAGMMGAAGIAAMLASRPASRWYALLLAAAATLALNPRASADPGWQLSFAAVAGILTMGPPLRRILTAGATELAPLRLAQHTAPRRRTSAASSAVRALLHGLAEGASITVAATVATAPLLAHHFGSVSLASLPANLLALPAVAPAMWLGLVKAALGQAVVLGSPVAPVAGLLAEALGSATGPPVAYLAGLAERFADLPGGQLSLPLASHVAVVSAYVTIAGVALCAGRAARRLSPHAVEAAARWRRLSASRRSAILAALAAILALGAARALAPPPLPEQLTIRFLDVGQGDATLIQHPDGTALLFDGGPPEAGVSRLLRRAGVRRLALVVATHASRDHHGGLGEVLRRYPVDILLDGGDGTRDGSYRALLRQAAERGVRRLPVTAPMTLVAGALTVRVLGPAPRPPGPPPEDPNLRAVVAVVSAGGFDVFLSADAESESLLPLGLPDVEAMKVPHHGSSDPGLAAVLERLRPELAAIEVGPNTYGHPAPETLATLRRAGVPTYRTDRNGAVSLSVAGGAAEVRTER
jgi:competence protein ComEC